MIINWEAAGAIGEVVGAVAVVVTLFYLAGQVRANRDATGAETERHLIQEWDDNFAALADAPEKGSIMTRGFRDVASLSEPELYVFDTKLASIVTAHYNVFRTRDHGFMAPSTSEGTDRSIAWLLTSPGGRFWYRHHRFLIPHAEHIDRVLEETDIESYDEWWSAIVRDAQTRENG